MKNIIFGIMLILCLAACSKHNNPTPPAAPGKATLLFPATDAVCTIGTVKSATVSEIQLQWSGDANTNSYEVHIKNLYTHADSVAQANNSPLNVLLKRSTPYSWYVISKSSKSSSTAQSDTWKFYTSGPGAIVYAPFPAELIAPKFGATVSATSVMLQWKGSDVQADASLMYDVYFGTDKTPTQIIMANTSATSSFSVTVTAGQTYYWKVVTKDSFKNSSESGVYQFSVK
ncbi:hypothetical protein [Mucilaginibacter sp. L3T2-6]|uniref:hypothetical protein n=1 Tax=Mucilaginibacter sp. L3T2-6 TaxID=3062491 RepID=UPI0026748C34|nr:hypothetical protein [Mucilaginibacter sp. L3T2-6]MDO3641264.1 hypothetical protein [Mucilaginibacter sp. L3T2-6]MDV6213976.1 hypothetical protein [Mucilaginibacter sp. L3T2-6]